MTVPTTKSVENGEDSDTSVEYKIGETQYTAIRNEQKAEGSSLSKRESNSLIFPGSTWDV